MTITIKGLSRLTLYIETSDGTYRSATREDLELCGNSFLQVVIGPPLPPSLPLCTERAVHPVQPLEPSRGRLDALTP